MKILLAGASGYVGEIIDKGLNNIYDIIRVNKSSAIYNNILCDLSDYECVKKLNAYKPDVIIHAAGNKDINFCENYPQSAYLANTLSLINLVRVFGNDVKIIYLSTDYVFEGSRGYYNESDIPHPLTEYGRSKLNAEMQCLDGKVSNIYVLRVSALYDMNATFPKYVINSLMQGNNIECYSNIFYSPTYYKDFLILLRRIIESNTLTCRIYHSCGDRISRFDFAKKICSAFKYDCSLIVNSQFVYGNKYLFHDLSMRNADTENELGVKHTNIDKILSNLN